VGVYSVEAKRVDSVSRYSAVFKIKCSLSVGERSEGGGGIGPGHVPDP